MSWFHALPSLSRLHHSISGEKKKKSTILEAAAPEKENYFHLIVISPIDCNIYTYSNLVQIFRVESCSLRSIFSLKVCKNLPYIRITTLSS